MRSTLEFRPGFRQTWYLLEKSFPRCEAAIPETPSRSDLDARLEQVGALAESVRRALYRYVVAQDEPVTREQAAAGIGVALHVAKFNLDRLVEAGLLDADYRRPLGVGGPGAGRPAKAYRRADTDVEVSLP